jgi:hypothetical protein
MVILQILTWSAFFPIEHRRTESVCDYAINSQFDVLYLDIWHNHYTCNVTTKKSDVLKISTEANRAQFILILGTAALFCWCCVRIEIIHPNWLFYSLITSLFVVRMRIIVWLGLHPRDIIPRIRTTNSDVIEQ